MSLSPYAPIPEEWTHNRGEHARALVVGMEVQFSSGWTTPVVAAGPSSVTVYDENDRRIQISPMAEVKYRRSRSTEEPNQPAGAVNHEEAPPMTTATATTSSSKPARKRTRKAAASGDAPKPAGSAAPKPKAAKPDGPGRYRNGATLMGYGVSPLIAWFGAKGFSTDETLGALKSLKAPLAELPGGEANARKYIAPRIGVGRRGRTDVLRPAEPTSEHAELFKAAAHEARKALAEAKANKKSARKASAGAGDAAPKAAKKATKKAASKAPSRKRSRKSAKG